MKIVYFGSDVFLPCFRYLAERDEILALYTYHNDEDYFSDHLIVREAKNRGIPVFYGRISESRVRSFFNEESCDLFFSAEYGYIIPVPEDIESFRGLNIHSSSLPAGRGYYPIEGAMERGLTETGVTMHKIRQKPDTGDILFKEPIAISPDMDSVDVYLESSRLALLMTKRLFGDFDKFWYAATVQDLSGERWMKPAENLRVLSHEMTTDEVMSVYRRFNQMTLIDIGGKLHHVMGVEPGRSSLLEPEIEVSTDRLLYGTADGHVRLTVLTKLENTR